MFHTQYGLFLFVCHIHLLFVCFFVWGGTVGCFPGANFPHPKKCCLVFGSIGLPSRQAADSTCWHWRRCGGKRPELRTTRFRAPKLGARISGETRGKCHGFLLVSPQDSKMVRRMLTPGHWPTIKVTPKVMGERITTPISDFDNHHETVKIMSPDPLENHWAPILVGPPPF